MRRIERRARWVRASQSIRDNTPDGWTQDTSSWLGTSSPTIWVGQDTPASFLPTFGQKLAAVSRATGLIADTLAGVPWHTYRGRTQLSTPRWITDPQNAQQDGRTAAGMALPLTGVQFWSWVITDMLWHGEAFLWTGSGALESSILHPIHPSDVDDVSTTGGIHLSNTPPEQWIPADEIIHMRGRAPYVTATSGGYRGVGILTRHAQTLGLAEAVDTYAGSTFQSGVPSGYLKATQPGLTENAAQTLASAWMAKHGQRRQVAVLGDSVEFVPLSMSPVDAQLIGMQDFTLREIAHAFGMSSHYLDVSGSTDTYANVQDRQLDFRQLTLLPWARLIESELDTRLPVATSLKLRLDGLERGTTGQRFDDYTKALAGGWMTVDEVRTLENLPPIDGGTP